MVVMNLGIPNELLRRLGHPGRDRRGRERPGVTSDERTEFTRLRGENRTEQFSVGDGRQGLTND